MREHRRMIDKALNAVHLDKDALDTQEQNSLRIARQAGARNDLNTVRAHVRQVARVRQMRTQMDALTFKLTNTRMQIASLSSQHALATVMHNLAKTMVRMNQTINMPQMQHIVSSFERESMRMHTTGEMIDDALDTQLDSTELESDQNEMENQIMDEIGLHLQDSMINTPHSSFATQNIIAQQSLQQQQQVAEKNP